MKLFRILFGKRRWILWLPYIAGYCVIDQPQRHIFGFFIASTIMGSPLLLAWWLSDGFTDIPRDTYRSESSPSQGISLYYNSVDGFTQTYPGPGSVVMRVDD